jgi:hypothetical protein
VNNEFSGHLLVELPSLFARQRLRVWSLSSRLVADQILSGSVVSLATPGSFVKHVGVHLVNTRFVVPPLDAVGPTPPAVSADGDSDDNTPEKTLFYSPQVLFNAMKLFRLLRNQDNIIDPVKYALRICKRSRIHCESGRIANLQAVEDSVGDEPDDGDGPSEVQVEAHAVLQASLRPFPLPPLGIGFDMASVVVNFDNCSHSSGIMRGYVKCPWGHKDCFKYQQVNVAGNRERLIAFLSAWAIMGEGLDREAHSGHDPLPANVDLPISVLFPPIAA